MLYNKNINVPILAKHTLMITAQKTKFSIKDLFSKCDQIRSFLRIWSHLLKKSLMGNFIFCAVDIISYRTHTSQVLPYKTK